MTIYNQWDENSSLRRAQDKNPSVSEIFKPITGIINNPLNVTGTAIANTRIGQDYQRNQERRRQLNQPMRNAAAPLAAGSMSKLQTIPFLGNNRSSEPLTNKALSSSSPNAPGLRNLDSSQQRTNPVYTNIRGGLHVGDPTMNLRRSGGVPAIGRGSMTTANGLELSNSSLSPEQLNAFMRTPVHGGTRARSGPGFGTRPAGGWHPDYQSSSGSMNNSREAKMPRFTAPGFRGSAKAARIHSQQQQWLEQQQQNQAASKLARIGEEGSTQRTQMNNQNALSKLELMGQNQRANTSLMGQNQRANTSLMGQNQRANTSLMGRNQQVNTALAGRNQRENTSLNNAAAMNRVKESNAFTSRNRNTLTKNQAASQMNAIQQRYLNNPLYDNNGKVMSLEQRLENDGLSAFYGSLAKTYDPASEAFKGLIK